MAPLIKSLGSGAKSDGSAIVVSVESEEPGAAVWPGTAAVSALQGDHHRMASAVTRTLNSQLGLFWVLKVQVAL